jgi:hypothetical protein
MGVTVQVDEPGCDHLAGDVGLLPARRQADADRRHPVARDGHVAHRVQARFRVDDPPAAEHSIIINHGEPLPSLPAAHGSFGPAAALRSRTATGTTARINAALRPNAAG